MARLIITGCLWAAYVLQLVAAENTVLSLDSSIGMALRENHRQLNLINQAEIAELDYQGARSVYKTRFGSRMSSDARSGADVGSVYSMFVNKDNQSGSKYSAGYYNSTFGDRSLSELRFSYTLPFFKNPVDNKRLAIGQAEINLARSKRMIEIGSEELVNQVVSSYYRLAMGLRSEDLAENRLIISQNLLNAQEIRFDNGDLSELALAESNLEVSSARQRRELARFDRIRQENHLKLLLGMRIDDSLVIDPEVLIRVDDALFSLPLEELELQAITHRIELIAKNEELLMAGQRIKSTSGGIIPPMEVSLQYALVGEGDRFDESMQFDDQRFGIGLRMNTDFAMSDKRMKQRKLYLHYQSMQREFELLQDQIKMDVRNAFFNSKQSSSRLELAMKTLDFTRQKHQQAEILHDRGDLTDLELLQSNQRIADAEHQALASKVDYILAGQRLAMASGYSRQKWKY